MNASVSRRTLLNGTAAASALGLSGVPARAEVNWKKYAGTKLEVILAKGPRGDNLQKYIKEFTDLTGIQVESEQIPEQQQRQKCVIELASGKPSFDVVHLSYHVQKRQFEKAGWLADITPFMKDPSLTAPDLSKAISRPRACSYAKDDKGQMLSLPWSVDYFILYYNKEIFQKAGVQVPKTLDEMNALAEKLTDTKAGIYRLCRARPEERQHDAVDQLLPQLRRRIPRRQGQHPHRRPGGDRGDEVLRSLQQVLASGRRGLQLDGVARLLRARTRRDVDRRRRLGAGRGKSELLARRRQGRLRDGAGRTEGPVFGHLRRRHRHSGRRQEQGSRVSPVPVDRLEEAGRAPAAGRRRRAVPQFDPQRSGSAERRDAAEGMVPVGDRCRQDLASSACRSSSRSPNSATSSAPP